MFQPYNSNPAYITPAEAFELSGCSDQDDFWEKLNRLVKDGLPSISRPNVLGSQFEDTPPLTWINCDLYMDGVAISRWPERIRPEHLHAERGAGRISDDACLPVVRIDVRLLRAAVLRAWKAATPQENHRLLSESDVFNMLKEKVVAGKLAEGEALELVRSIDPRWRQAHGPGGNGSPGVRAILGDVTGHRKRGDRRSPQVVKSKS